MFNIELKENDLGSLVESGFIVVGCEDTGLSALTTAIKNLPKVALAAFLENNNGASTFLSSIEKVSGCYFNDENPPVVDYSFASPTGSVVSCGSFYFAVNPSSDSVDVCEYDGNLITLPPSTLCVINIGLVGIPFSFNNTDLFQGVVHSSLDGIDYFGSGCVLSQTEIFEEPPALIYEKPLDVKSFVRHGFAENSVTPEYAAKLLGCAKKEHYVPVSQNEIDKQRDYTGRFISKHSMFKPSAIKPQYSDLINATSLLCKSVLFNKPNPSGDNLSVFCATKGHFMARHADCGDASPVITLIYLSDDEFGHGDGGEVAVSLVKLSADSSRFEFEKTEVMSPPIHGLVIHLNNSNSKFNHEVHKILSDKFRYSIIVNSSMLTNPQWDTDFVEEEGKFEVGEIVLGKPM